MQSPKNRGIQLVATKLNNSIEIKILNSQVKTTEPKFLLLYYQKKWTQNMIRSKHDWLHAQCDSEMKTRTYNQQKLVEVN